jgi:hypothetical protein
LDPYRDGEPELWECSHRALQREWSCCLAPRAGLIERPQRISAETLDAVISGSAIHMACYWNRVRCYMQEQTGRYVSLLREDEARPFLATML